MAAGNAIIGALRVILGADTAQFEDALKRAATRAGFFGGVIGGISSELTKTFGRAIGAVASAIPKAIDGMDNLGKSAQKIGIPVEELSALKFAAELSDVSMESLTKSVGKLSRAMVEAAAKPTSEAANAFKALGVSVTDGSGKLKSSSAVLEDIAGKFEGLKDGAGKTAVAMAIFGKAGADMIPLLNSGKAGFQGMMEEARQLGIVIDTKTAKSAEEFNDNLKRLGTVKDAIIIKITAGMLPALQALSQRWVDAAKESDVVNRITSALSGAFAIFARGVMLVADNIGLLVKIIGLFVAAQIGVIVIGVALAFAKLALAVYTTGVAMTLLNAVKALSLKGWLLIAGGIALVTGQFDTLKEKMKDIAAAFEKMLPEGEGIGFLSLLKDLGVNIRALEVDLTKYGASAGGATKKQDDFNYSLLGGKSAIDSFLESQRKSLASQQAELATVGLAAGAKERLRVVLQGLQIATANQIPITDALRMQLTAAGDAAGNLALKLQGAQLVQQNLAPHEAFRLEMTNNTLAMQAFGATTEQIARMQEATAMRYGNTWGQVGESVAGSFQKIGQSFAKESRSMAIVAKVAGIAQATISMFTGAAKALELPFPANLAAWASVLATGASAVAGIKSVNTGGFATGGAITVPGGMGGGDKVRAMVDLEPGEQLDIWRPDNGGTDPRRGGGEMREVTIRADSFARPFIEAFIPQLNAALRDGHVLKLAPA